MKKKILCLSRAPLDFKGGIPEYCKYIYMNLNQQITVANYSLDKKSNRIILNSYRNIIFVDEIFMLLFLPGLDLIRLTITRLLKGKNPFLL